MKALAVLGVVLGTALAVVAIAGPPPAFHQPPGSPIALEREAIARNYALRAALKRNGFAAGFHKAMIPPGCVLQPEDDDLPLAAGNAEILCDPHAEGSIMAISCAQDLVKFRIK